MSPSQYRPTGLQCRKTVVFGGAPGTDGRSRLRRIAWTPSVVREAEIVALGSPKTVRIGWMTTFRPLAHEFGAARGAAVDRSRVYAALRRVVIPS